MNNTSTANPKAIARPSTHLISAIIEIKTSVGDGLSDGEFTRLLQRRNLPNEAGFEFLSYSDRFVTLTVSRQDLANWYPEHGWIAPEKESIARAIAKKYELWLCEPPDLIYPQPNLCNPHHHLALFNRQETIIIAHPEYLKVRLFGAMTASVHSQTVQQPLPLGPDLLHDLSILYKP